MFNELGLLTNIFFGGPETVSLKVRFIICRKKTASLVLKNAFEAEFTVCGGRGLGSATTRYYPPFFILSMSIFIFVFLPRIICRVAT